ncbi:hypothetical protein [Streptomyces ziwulingensis]|uniref:Minor tail protein n=1 Tax=Streptomyces ziwulingensis TaxID=1045501 RepID=A0ABP9BRU1_9ACTN
MKPAPSINRDLAAALGRKAQRVGATTPSVRGADWRLAVVTAVAGDGTVTADGISGIRCMDNYALPAVDDVIVIDQNSAGNWLAWGRTATSSGWTTLTLAAGMANPGHGWTPSYLREGRRIWLRGRLGPTSGGIADGTTLLTLPTAIRPTVSVGWAVARDASVTPATLRLEITSSTGAMRTFQSTNLPTWVALDGISYTI